MQTAVKERKLPAFKPRVLFVINDPIFFLSHRLILARAALASGFEVAVCAPNAPDAQRIKKEGFHFIPLELERWGMNPFKELAALKALVRIYRTYKPHIVHHVTIKPVLYGSFAAQITGVPAVVNAISGLGYIFISEGLIAQMRRAFIKLIYKLAFCHNNQRVIFQNPDDRDFFIREKIIDGSEFALINGSGVHPGAFHPVAERGGEPIILMVARLLRDKGVYEFVEAARVLKRKGIKARFLIAGAAVPDNPAGVSLSQIKVWQSEQIVEFLGHQEDMVKLYQAAQIVCLPSYREGLPKALVEAAACGKALVATDVPGCREIVREGVNGLLVPVREVAGLARAIQFLLANPDVRQTMGELGRELVLGEDYTEESIARKTLEVYQSLLKPLGIKLQLPEVLLERWETGVTVSATLNS